MVACGVKTGNRTSEIDQMDDVLPNLGTKACRLANRMSEPDWMDDEFWPDTVIADGMAAIRTMTRSSSGAPYHDSEMLHHQHLGAERLSLRTVAVQTINYSGNKIFFIIVSSNFQICVKITHLKRYDGIAFGIYLLNEEI